MQNKALTFFQKRFNKGSKEKTTVRNLYLTMEKVGGYSQLLNLPLPALNEILKCMEWEAREKNKPGGKK